MRDAPAITRRSAKSNRVELERGRISEWYVNGPLGLEQGFTLQAPPGYAADSLVLEFEVRGAKPRLASNGSV